METFITKNLCFSYPERNEKALSDISVKINKGEFVTVCGSSGSGKSTFLKLFKPVVAPFGTKEGEIIFEGKNIDNIPDRILVENIGYVLQNPSAQIITDKVWHEVAFGLESLAINDVEIRKRVLDIADFFGIQHLLDKKTNELSGGEKQIVNLASVMVMNPKVLLLDEPTSQLDKDIADTFLSAVKKVNNELSVTVIITEHRLDSVLPIS
ncbi:MAG: ABC transporter ATP-binding protein, partial [Bacillota bacterium]|nr:ABC transporter ATP-binding protein [Bacillota bacterium]